MIKLLLLVVVVVVLHYGREYSPSFLSRMACKIKVCIKYPLERSDCLVRGLGSLTTQAGWYGRGVVEPRSESVRFLLFSSEELLLSLVLTLLGSDIITWDIYTCNALHNINVEMKQ